MITRRKAVQLSLLTAFLPGFVQSAWGADRRTELFEGMRRATDGGRPLLVFLVPAEREQWYARGQALGAVLNHGGDEVLAALALCEVVCGDAAEVAELLGAEVPEDTWTALIETDRVPATVRFAQGPRQVSSVRRWEQEGWMASLDAETEAAIRFHRDALIELVMPDRAALVRYAAHAEAADPIAAAQVRRGATLSAEVVDGAPAVLALAAADRQVDPVVATQVLAEVGRTRFVEEVVPGSRWAHAGGCGTQIEGEEPVMMGCGMGYTSAKARRMLYFFEG